MGIMVIVGPIDLPALCERLRVLVTDGDVEVVVCDVRAVAADAATVNALACLQLTARRLGGRIRLHRASPELDRLLGFFGLTEVFAVGRKLCVQAQRQTEEREHPCRVEEGVDGGDPTA